MAMANVKLAAVRSKRANLARSSAADEDGAQLKDPGRPLARLQHAKANGREHAERHDRLEDRTNAIFGDLHFSFWHRAADPPCPRIGRDRG